jgi:MFS family permease
MAALDRQTTERNMRYLVIELVWAAVAIGCYSFAAAFVIRLGGTNLQVSLISSAAALVNALTTIPFAIFLERRARRWPWVVGSLWLLRAGHIGLIVIPFLPAYQAEAVVIPPAGECAGCTVQCWLATNVCRCGTNCTAGAAAFGTQHCTGYYNHDYDDYNGALA